MRRALPLLFRLAAGLMALVASTAFGPGHASAQTADAGSLPMTPLAESLSGAAKQAYEAGAVLANNKDCTRAIGQFAQAYELSRDPRLIFNIAVCYRDLHAYARMQGSLRRYRQEAAATITPDQSADVDAALAAIRGLVGTVHLIVAEDGAEVSVDGERVGTTPLAEPLVLDLGKHTLAVTKTAFVAVERTLEIAGGNETSLAIDFVREVHPALLRVSTERGATVEVDKTLISLGSFEGRLPPGAHDVHVSKPGKKAYDASLVLADGESRSVQVSLEGAMGPTLWPWVAGGVAVLAGVAIGGYFLIQPQGKGDGAPQGQLFTLRLPAGN